VPANLATTHRRAPLGVIECVMPQGCRGAECFRSAQCRSILCRRASVAGGPRVVGEVDARTQRQHEQLTGQDDKIGGREMIQREELS
jgi:hypothetical protein